MKTVTAAPVSSLAPLRPLARHAARWDARSLLALDLLR